MNIRNFIQVLVILYFSIGQANAQVPRNCKEILDLNPAALSGVYSIDPDGTGPLPTMDCQCDMVTDGGGWTLILNYNHLTATNPSLNVRTNSLPLMGQASLGFDESGTIFWGHTSNSLFNSLNFSEVRFYAKTSNHNRVINFKTSNQNVLNYFKTGTGSTSGIATNFSPLAGHTSFLPAAIDMTTSNQGDLSLTEYPMWTANAYHWYISPSAPNSNGRWEVDDCWVNFCTSLAIPNPSTHHEVWGRTCTSYSKTIQESENYFDWNGTTYTESGIFEKTLVNSAGCDSIAQLDLTIIDVPCGSFDDTLIQHVGNKMIKVNQVTGESVDWFTISNLGSTEVTRLTWNDAHQCFYTIARLPGGAATATQKWVLIGRIGTDGIYSNLGQISIPSETIFHLESIAYSYLDNNLYVAGSLDNNLSSESLIRINTSTMTGEFVGLFTSTQNDADGMEFDLSGNVYYFDGIPGSSTRLYKQDVAFQNPAELLVNEGYAAYNDITIKGDTVFITINNQIRKLLPSTNAFVTVGNMTPSAIYSGLTFKGLSRTPYKFNFQGDTSATACSSFEWHGNNLTQSGIYFDTLQAKNGCDSLVKLNLTITTCPNTASGIINKYTPVTAINVCENSISVTNASEFSVGDRVLLIQMKGAEINTDNALSFGDVTDYGDAGNYEFANILSISGNEVTLVNKLLRSYAVSGFVQLIYVPVYVGDVLVDNTLTCEAWNGSTGGVLIFETDGSVFMNADIDVSSKGFRGGLPSVTGNDNCGAMADYYFPNTFMEGAGKGEGIFQISDLIANGRGKNANGGGGGNNHNAGGGGGSNYGFGGRGGREAHTCPMSLIEQLGGFGGLSLPYNNSTNKIFLGGGGGGAQQNNNNGSPGTNGGGIIIIKGDKIFSNNKNISSFSFDSNSSQLDGVGGVGAGGTVLLDVNEFLGDLTIDIHGGNGGDATLWSHALGAGGGGGGGIVWTSSNLSSNVSIDITGGQPGYAGNISNVPGNWGATAGGLGGSLNGLVLPESTIPFNQTTLTSDTAATSCSSFTWYGTTYSQAGDYTHTLQSINGCDSIVTLHLTITTCPNTASGIINKYTPVTAINVCENSISVANASEFNVGDRVLLIQMKGAEINTDNSPTFGDITNYSDAGNYEFANILSIVGNEITFVNQLLRSYTVSGLVQLVYVPVYTGDVLVENTLTCEAWNGSIGGVLVFESDGTVYVNNDIDVSDKGFRSGPVNPNGGIVCGQLDFFYPISSVLGGRKGEGIHELPNSMVSGRGKNANGGGGGNNTNSGGAGGGNYGLGGIGGNQWYDAGACQIIPNGGRGGSSLTYSNLNNKVFLGGGAGGGHQNDATATPGTNGGGIVILNCSAISAIGGGIKAFANNSVPSPNDGAGGGGAGGSVLLKANNILGNLSIDVHGGRGGNSTTLGPGGGGGGGLVWTSNPLTSNVILNTSGGDAGLSTHYGDSYGAGAGNIGGRLNGLVLPESIIPFNQTTLTGDTTATSCSSFTWYGTTYSQAGDYTHTLQSVNGCDSIVTLHLSINSSISTIDTQNACESFTWIDGNTYTQSTNTPSVTLQSISGCDSIVTLNLTINQELSSDTNAISCLSFTWYGTTYNQSGDYTHNLQSVNGCDSLVTLHLSINSSISTIDTQSACESFTWIDGNTYTQSTNTPSVTLQSVLGCDSIVTLNLTIFNAVTRDTNVVACENFTWNGTTYSSSGTYSQNLQTVHGCDSLVNLNLTINQTSIGDTTASACTSFSWYGNSYSNSGDFQHVLTNSVGCDSTVTLHLTIFPPSSSDTSATACESFTWYGTTYNQSGTYSHLLQTVNGCDSTVNLNLSILNSNSSIDTQSACESFTWIDGNTYNQSTNTPSVTLQSVLGCDSIVTLNLSIFNAVTRDTNVVACENFTWYGTNYSNSGTYSQNLQTIHGCDSLVNLNLTINQTSIGDTTASVCSSFSWYGNSYSNSGDFQHILTNSVGCDSTVTLHLTIFPTSSSDTSATACESFTWYGTTYNQSGTYPHLLQTVNGCDSTVNLNLSILNSNSTIDTQSACESFTWIDGNTYTQSTNTPSVTLQSVLGCDSIVTLNLTIFNAITRDTNVVACENFTWNGTTYSSSGTYSQNFQTIHGCDSLVNLNLTINQTSVGDTTASVCSSFSWYGNSYSNSGDFQHVLTNSVGCDSTVTLHLTIFPTSSSDTSATACESFTWYGTTYNQSGTYSHLLQTVNGCDSTVNLNLTINQVVIHEDIIVSWTGSYTWIDGITYTNSNNTASFTFPNAAANGCDSIVTLDLFVGVRGYDTIIACDSYTWIDGITYSQSTNTPEFTFPNGSSLGADSVSILVLTINQSSSSIDVQSACLSYTWMDGNTYTSSTNAPTFTLQNAVGCDSIITLNLTIFNPTIGDTSASACETFTWYGNTYAASGDYSQLLQSQNGCDSTVILHLTIHQATFGDTTAISCGAFTWYGNNYPNSGTYTHLLQNMHGCDSLVSLNLTVNEFQSFDVNLVSCGTHTWNGINYDSSGTYTQSFPIGEACDSIVNLNLTLIPKPLAQFSTDKLETDIVNPSILFENQSENAISYLWNLGDGVSSDEVDLEHSYSEPNNYTIRLIAYATEDCTDTAFVTIKVTNVPIYYVPNSFTPNGDELNNTFKPIFGPNFTPKEYEFRIYNRWGEVLFVSFDPSIGWDGTYLELGLVQNGVYTYQINFLSNEQEVIKLTGTVNVIR